MGHLGVDDLAGLGRAAVRALNWISRDLVGELQEAIGRYIEQVAAAGGDAYGEGVVAPPGIIVGGGSFSPDNDSWWEVDLWTPREWESTNEQAVWCLTFGRHHSFFGEIRLLKRLEGYPFKVVVTSDRREGMDRLLSMPRLVEWARGQRDVFPDARRTTQALDVFSRYVVVTVDPDWADDHIRESVMAQTVEWSLRVAGSPYARLPTLADDVYQWWLDWATRVARRRNADERSLADLFEVARRSVRPDSAAGHRLYWKKSLASPPDGVIVGAAAEAGISRRTAYARLRAGGRRLSDFLSHPDPRGALVEYLKAGTPPSRLSDERRSLICLLRTSGMKPEAARKLERRIRQLPPCEQEARVRAAIRRASRRR